MTFLQTFENKRSKLKQALELGGIRIFSYKKHDIPKGLPAAIIVLSEEKGKNENDVEFERTDISFDVYLVIDGTLDDPDLVIYSLKEQVRDAYIKTMFKDFPKVEYYDSMLKNIKPVKIAKIHTSEG